MPHGPGGRAAAHPVRDPIWTVTVSVYWVPHTIISRLSSFHSIPQSLGAVVKAVAASCASGAVLAARKI
eukprot:9471452-Pyramimonas_sp.AAC.1